MKALVRRGEAHEKLEHFEEAIAGAFGSFNGRYILVFQFNTSDYHPLSFYVALFKAHFSNSFFFFWQFLVSF